MGESRLQEAIVFGGLSRESSRKKKEAENSPSFLSLPQQAGSFVSYQLMAWELRDQSESTSRTSPLTEKF